MNVNPLFSSTAGLLILTNTSVYHRPVSIDDPMIGRVLDGRYRLDELLGTGGMGAVYAGVQLSIDRPVAVKVLHPGRVRAAGPLRRFTLEARAISRLEHHNVVRLYDFGVSDDETPFLVMERLMGCSLADRIAGQANIPLAEAVSIVMQAARGIGAAHRRGIVHRDLKPGNIWLCDGPEHLVKVLDFGLANDRRDRTAERLTVTGQLVGTPSYMSPEQIETDAELTSAVDVYALGLILYRLCVGHNPFKRDTIYATLGAHLWEEAPSPTHADDGTPLPDALIDVLACALEKYPEDRYRDGTVLRRALRKARLPELSTRPWTPEEISPAARPAAPEPTAVTAVTPSTAPSGERRVVTFLAIRFDDEREAFEARVERLMSILERASQTLSELDVTVTIEEGRGVRAVFGVPVAGEGQALRALRAALQMVSTWPEARAALDTTLALILPGPGRSLRVVAEDEDRAWRLAAGSPTGRAALSEGAWAALRPHVGPGEAQPLPGDAGAMVVERLNPRLAGERRVFGRDELLASLLDEGRRALLLQRAGVRLLTGPAGIGKSTVLRELARRVAAELPDAAVLTLGPPPQKAPYGVLQSFLGDVDDLEPSGSGPLRRLSGLEPPSASDHASPGGLRHAGRAAFADHLSRRAAFGGVVLLVDDLHELDGDSLDLLAWLGTELERWPVFCVLAARPTQAVADRFDQPTEVDPLEAEAARRLARECLGEDAAPEVAAQIVSRARGNPLFVEELARNTVAGAGDALPASIHLVLQARLDRLPTKLRALLQDAAVVGARFWPGALAFGGRGSDDVRSGLEELAERGLITSAGAHADPDLAPWRFSAPLMGDVARESLSDGHRRKRHGAIADWMATHGAMSTALATHLDAAGRTHESGLAYRASADASRDRFANTAAAEAYRQAIARLGTRQERVEAGLELGCVLQALGDFEGAQPLLEAASSSAEKEPSVPVRVRALRHLARAAARRGDAEGSQALFEAAHGRAQEPFQRAQVAAELAFAYRAAGENERAADMVDSALEEALGAERLLPLLLPMANLYLVRTILHSTRAELPQAERTGREALETFGQASHPLGQASALNSLSTVYRGLGDYDRAVGAADSAAELFRKTGNPYHRITALTNLARARTEQGEPLAARAILNRLRAEHGRALRGVPAAFVVAEEALANAALGRVAEADDAATRCLEAARALGVPDALGRCHHAAGVVRRDVSLLNQAELAWRQAGRTLELSVTRRALARLTGDGGS